MAAERFTRRINTRHRLWGHLFGGRYKAIPAEPGNCFWALLDYIHLNPVRAGIVQEKDGIEGYAWTVWRRGWVGSLGVGSVSNSEQVLPLAKVTATQFLRDRERCSAILSVI